MDITCLFFFYSFVFIYLFMIVLLDIHQTMIICIKKKQFTIETTKFITIF